LVDRYPLGHDNTMVGLVVGTIVGEVGRRVGNEGITDGVNVVGTAEDGDRVGTVVGPTVVATLI